MLTLSGARIVEPVSSVMLTGRGVRVAVIDSGVNTTHPHVGEVAGGIAIDEQGIERADYLDRLGHGTAVTAAIRAEGARRGAVRRQGVRPVAVD